MKKCEIFIMFIILILVKIVFVFVFIYKILKKVFLDEYLVIFCYIKERFNELDKNYKY